MLFPLENYASKFVEQKKAMLFKPPIPSMVKVCRTLLSVRPRLSFSYRQECDVKRYMNSQSNKEEAAGTVLKASLPFLKSDECEKVKGQLSYIVQDMKEERQQSRSRGFHM